MALTTLGDSPTAYSLVIGLASGSLFGAVVVWRSRRAEKRLEAAGLDPGAMDPWQHATVDVLGDVTKVHEASRRALLKLRKIELTKDNVVTGELDAKSGATWQSFGELISVRIKGNGLSTTVTISSKPRFSATVVDHGKGIENVGLFRRYLLAEVDEAAPNQSLERSRER
jgi:hypothetical protein